MINLEHYARIKNNYCLGYFGTSDEHLVQLRLLRPNMERQFPGLKIYLGCKDASYGYLQGCDRVVKVSEIRKRKLEFAHVKELRFNGKEHVIDLFAKRCNLDCRLDIEPQKEHTALCVIVTEGSYPTKNLIKKQVDILKRVARERNYEVEVDGDIENAGMVMGVESPKLFEAAAKGIKTVLVPTGLGERLYERMFPNGEVLKV